MNYAYIITNDNMTVVFNGKSYSLARRGDFFEQAKQAILSKDYEKLRGVLDASVELVRRSNGKVSVRGGQVLYNNEPVHNVITERIIDFIHEGLPFEPLVKFLENLMENPSKRAVDELYKFLEHKNLPLTEDGCFLAYKAVTKDFKDKHTGNFNNAVGAIVKEARNKVCDDANQGCSSGLHIATSKFALDFGSGEDKFIIIKCNPRDVVSVPLDAECQKVRVCEYEVMSEYKADLKKPCYTHHLDDLKPAEYISKFTNNSWKRQKRDKFGHFSSKI